ncbi:MAG: bifunctional oligoribonuclease/PAP phosphatase NrnA [Oscillospiraceae bacterium]|nr:bifunctional oligoribonuclease/PAP phosphatase NrnA [Oscillospiraceae bacterium]
MKIALQEAAELLRTHDNILILSHAHPDGDTLGSSYALCRALLALGKNAAVLCEDEIPCVFSFVAQGMPRPDFEPDYVVAVDIATVKLMGDCVGERFGERVDLCIDHHYTNSMYAEKVLLDDTAAAACEIMYRVIREMGVEITPIMAECLYLGVSTDTGCFRYSNVTSNTLRTAAELMDLGADCARINREVFETKSRSFAALERLALNSVETYCDGLFATVLVTQEMFRESGAGESEFDKIAAIPRQIEGVLVGAAIREQKNGTYKVSVRTNPPMNAAEICAQMNGGGHPAAAGCTLEGTIEENRQTLLRVVETALRKAGKI